MSEVDNQVEDQVEDLGGENVVLDDRESIKNRLNLFGVSYASNLGTEKLRALLTAHLESLAKAEESTAEVKTEGSVKREVILEGTKLVRITLLANDPSKREHQGELFTVGNAVIGSIRKYIPFGVPWLVPQILVNVLEERQFQHFITKRNAHGGTYRAAQISKAYNIVRHELPDEQELTELAKAQALRSAGD